MLQWTFSIIQYAMISAVHLSRCAYAFHTAVALLHVRNCVEKSGQLLVSGKATAVTLYPNRTMNQLQVSCRSLLKYVHIDQIPSKTLTTVHGRYIGRLIFFGIHTVPINSNGFRLHVYCKCACATHPANQPRGLDSAHQPQAKLHVWLRATSL